MDESSFSDTDKLTLTLKVPQKYKIDGISFAGGNKISRYDGEDTAYWTMTTKTDFDCLRFPKFVATWSDVQTTPLADFKVVTYDSGSRRELQNVGARDGVQYLFSTMTLNLEEEVTSDQHNYVFNRTVVYEIPFAIELQSQIELEVDFQMIIPTVSPSTSPSGAPSVNPTNCPSTSPSGAPTLKAMDHLFTRYAIYSPDALRNSLVDINFTTIVRLPWTVQDQEFYIINDEDDTMVDDSEVFKLMDDCYSAFRYETVEGRCVDVNWRYPPSVYVDIPADPTLCKTICDQTDACQAYEVDDSFESCSIVGVDIDQTFTTSLDKYLPDGESFTYVYSPGGAPVKGRQIFGIDFSCNIKQTAAWQTDFCANVDGKPPHPDNVPECYCYQDWNLQYLSANVCGVSGWWTLGMTIESFETGNNLFYETDVWVGLASACAQVIGSTEVCFDEAPCSITGWDEPERTTPMSKFYVEEQAYFQITVGASAPIANVEVLEISLQQQNTWESVEVPSADYATSNLVSAPVDGFDNRFSATVDLTVDVNAPTFSGSIAGIASTIYVTAGITYEDGVTERRELSVYAPEGDEPSVDLELQILVYPKRCQYPAGNLGSHLVRTCAQGKTIRVCRPFGWETLVSECPEEEDIEDQPTSGTNNPSTSKPPQTEDDVTYTQQGNSQSTVIIENSSDNDTASLWKLLTVVAAGVVLLVVCVLWYCKQMEQEEEEKRIVQKTIEVQEESEWDNTDYSVTDTSYYQDKANQDFAMKLAYEEIFQQYTTHGDDYVPSVSGVEESDV